MPVLEDRVAQRGAARVAVEGELVELGVDVGERLVGGVVLELAILGLEHAPGALQGARLHLLDHGVGALVVDEIDLVDLGSAAPVALVGHHDRVLVPLVLRELEGAAADDRRVVLVTRPRGLARDGAPDVLGHDVHPHVEHVRFGLGAGEDHGGVVGSGDALDEVRVHRVVGELVLHDVVVGEGDVFGGQRHAVLPFDARADVERPDLAVGGRRPAVGEPCGRGALRVPVVAGAEADQKVVVERPDLVARRELADEGVQVVGDVGHAQLEHDLAGGRRAAAGGKCSGQTPDQAGAQKGGHADAEKATPRPTPRCSTHGNPPCTGDVRRSRRLTFASKPSPRWRFKPTRRAPPS